jgi:Rnl2 family RNA ligase
MDHRAYPKIPTRHDGSKASPGGTWVATEKVHGAQLVVASDGKLVRVGKRKAWLEPAEPFFGWQLLRGDLESAALAVQARWGGEGIVRLFGEIFGGHYPHPDVAPMPGVSAVQTGIWYCPDIRFALFDVLIEKAPDEEGIFLSHEEVEKVARVCGLFTVPVLGRGASSALEQLPVRYATRVPALLGLPSIDGNDAEGLVLKPDARAKPSERFVVKHKIPEFDEAKFDESAPWDSAVALDLDAFETIAARLVNAARVASASSKVGLVPEAVRDEVVLDVLVDLETAFPVAFRRLPPEDEEALRAHITRLAENLTRDAR